MDFENKNWYVNLLGIELDDDGMVKTLYSIHNNVYERSTYDKNLFLLRSDVKSDKKFRLRGVIPKDTFRDFKMTKPEEYIFGDTHVVLHNDDVYVFEYLIINNISEAPFEYISKDEATQRANDKITEMFEHTCEFDESTKMSSDEKSKIKDRLNLLLNRDDVCYILIHNNESGSDFSIQGIALDDMNTEQSVLSINTCEEGSDISFADIYDDHIIVRYMSVTYGDPNPYPTFESYDEFLIFGKCLGVYEIKIRSVWLGVGDTLTLDDEHGLPEYKIDVSRLNKWGMTRRLTTYNGNERTDVYYTYGESGTVDKYTVITKWSNSIACHHAVVKSASERTNRMVVNTEIIASDFMQYQIVNANMDTKFSSLRIDSSRHDTVTRNNPTPLELALSLQNNTGNRLALMKGGFGFTNKPKLEDCVYKFTKMIPDVNIYRAHKCGSDFVNSELHNGKIESLVVSSKFKDGNSMLISYNGESTHKLTSDYTTGLFNKVSSVVPNDEYGGLVVGNVAVDADKFGRVIKFKSAEIKGVK